MTIDMHDEPTELRAMPQPMSHAIRVRRYHPAVSAVCVVAVLVGLFVSSRAVGQSSPPPDGFTRLFDGESFSGWEGDRDVFQIRDGAIVGGSLERSLAKNAFLCTTREFDDFELRLRVRLEGRGDNGGIQFRSHRVPDHHEVSGYQADIGTVGATWFNEVIGAPPPESQSERAPVWGSLYDETRRDRYLAWGLPDAVTPVLRIGDWNDMAVRASGRRIQISVNGLQTVDYFERSHVAQSGIICLQVHSGSPAEVSHKDIDIKPLPTYTFTKEWLSDVFYSEGANFGDIDGDGHNDIVAGPYWYAGPDFTRRHEFYAPKPFDPAGYSDNFFPHVYDFNGDDRNDILVVGFPGQTATWYENPGPQSPPATTPRHWNAHVVVDTVDNESPWWTDLTGDGRPEIVAIAGGRYGYMAPDWSAPHLPWTFHPISKDGGWQRFTHGLGVGDVNGDGRMDILEKAGWWEQPPSLVGDPVWQRHDVTFAERGGSQMYAYDVDGDGDNDVISSLAAHDYGLAWFENVGEGEFVRHMIMNEYPKENKYGVAFAELHAIDLVDMDGDGIKDIVTGKRWWSHGAEGDPDPNPRAWLYWFRIDRSVVGIDGSSVDFVPHLIDADVGVGVQIVAGDIDGDGLPDVVVGNKKGTAVLLQNKIRMY